MTIRTRVPSRSPQGCPVPTGTATAAVLPGHRTPVGVQSCCCCHTRLDVQSAVAASRPRMSGLPSQFAFTRGSCSSTGGRPFIIAVISQRLRPSGACQQIAVVDIVSAVSPTRDAVVLSTLRSPGCRDCCRQNTVSHRCSTHPDAHLLYCCTRLDPR